MQLRTARVLHRTTAEGPGLRTAVWVQGCSIRCSGCINPHLFRAAGGTPTDPQLLADAAVAHGCVGITILGGEPFDQPEACAELAEAAQQRGLGVLTFTGYLFVDLDLSSAAPVRRLLDSTDLLVDGPYRNDQPENERALVGSRNQRLIYLSARYLPTDLRRTANRVQFLIAADGSIQVAGFLTTAQRDRIAHASELRPTVRRRPTQKALTDEDPSQTCC